jgi:hypothetical protein
MYLQFGNSDWIKSTFIFHKSYLARDKDLCGFPLGETGDARGSRRITASGVHFACCELVKSDSTDNACVARVVEEILQRPLVVR